MGLSFWTLFKQPQDVWRSWYGQQTGPSGFFVGGNAANLQVGWQSSRGAKQQIGGLFDWQAGGWAAEGVAME